MTCFYGSDVFPETIELALLQFSRQVSDSFTSGCASGSLLHLVHFDCFHFREDDENSKRYHVPRRRRLGFPPITPNACVRDAVLHQVFDNVWSGVVHCLASSNSKFKTSLLKVCLIYCKRSNLKLV